MGMKANSGFFKSTLGSSFKNYSLLPETYSNRNIDIPNIVKSWMVKLNKKGDTLLGRVDDFSMSDVSVLSKETGVEYAKIVIANKAYLIRGDKNGTSIPKSILNELINVGGILEFHSHPFNDDLSPSVSDKQLIRELKKITGQTSSKIITPNGRFCTFNEAGVVEIRSIPNYIDENYRKELEKLFGGLIDD